MHATVGHRGEGRTDMAERVYAGLDADERADRRREQLLAAGLERFAADGWTATTVADICDEAGLSRRYLYEHFEDREALFLAVLDRVAADVEEVVRRSVAVAVGPPADRARAVLAALVAHFTADPRTVRVALIESLATPAFRARRRQLLARFSELAARLMAAFRPTQTRDRATRDRAALFGALLTGGLVELLIAWATDGTPLPPEEFTDHVATLAEAAARA